MSASSAPLTADVAIVGGGFSGTMVAVHLLRHARAPFSVAIVERRPDLGRGVAYSTEDACHLLNVPAAGMSAFPDEPGHFLTWLKGQPGFAAAGPATFAPRRLYGRYVQGLLDAAEAAAAPGMRLVRVQDEAIALRPAGAGARLTLSSGQEFDAGRVVLALGHFPPADPPVPGAAAVYQSERYVAEPWASQTLAELDPDEDVLLIGSGLTAIDLILSLAERGHMGRMHMLSRRGFLPQVHVPGLAPKALTPPAGPHTARRLLAWVRDEVRIGEAEGLNWRQVIDGLRPHLQGLWRDLPPEERRRFLRHGRGFWEVHRHRMAPEVAGAIAALRAADQLALYAGRLQGLALDAAGVTAVISGKSGMGTLTVQRVVNCTGPEADFRKKRHPLVVSLLEQGLARPDALGMGLAVAGTGALLDSQGEPSTVLYTLGPARKGELWETTAVPELRGQALALATAIGSLTTSA